MKKLLILSLLFCSTAYACENYEECMEKTVHGYETGRDLARYNAREFNTLKAIAFKLDEISKKLNKPEAYFAKAVDLPTDLESCLELARKPVVYKENIDDCYKRFK